MLRLAVFASGGGTNLQAILDHFHSQSDPVARVALVISDRAGAGALARAEKAGVPSCVIPASGRDMADIAADTLETLERERIDLIALAGYLRLVPEPVVQAYRRRIVNVHPALLPAFGGKGMYGERVHRAVVESGTFVTGVTVHFVDERYDEGRPLIQWPVPVLRGDTPSSLAARVLEVEHVVYPLAIERLARSLIEHAGDAGAAAAGFDAASGCFVLNEGGAANTIAPAVRRLLGLEGKGS